MNRLKKYNQLYRDLYALAESRINTVFEQNEFFSGDHHPELSYIKNKHQPRNPSFINVLHKYYLMTTLGKYKFSFNHFFKIVFLLFIINIRFRRFKQIVKFYNSVIDREIENLQHFVPEIDISSKKHQIVKVVLANVITKFINTNVLKPKSLMFTMEKMFYMGYYIGVTYIISDQILDSPNYSDSEKKDFHNIVQRVLSNSDYSEFSQCRFYSFVKQVAEDCKSRFPFSDNEAYYKILFLLEQSQYEDLCFNYKRGNKEMLISKSCLAALKTQFSLIAVNQQLCNDLNDNVRESILWTLYCQMTDDIRDINEDKEQNIQTLFTLDESHNKFNPYKLYIFLSTIFVRKYYAKWMYSDLLNILNDNELYKEVKQDDKKINVFTNKILGLEFA